MSNKLFGTDGARGVANVGLTASTAYRMGVGAVRVLGPRIVMGRDTRRSGPMLASALAAGIMAAGGTVLDAGVIPTPAVAYLVGRQGAHGGVVISASHNPPQDNGIKFFGPDGMKATDEVEDALAAIVEQGPDPAWFTSGAGVGTLVELADATDAYVGHAVGGVGVPLCGLKVVVDCAHGASCVATPRALRCLGVDVVAINTGYDGFDINVGCGSTHLDALRAAVLEHGADVGLAHDGDADRVLFVDERGHDVNGDHVLAICGLDLARQGRLAGGEVVSTVMANLGLGKCLEEAGVSLVKTDVGDKYVLRRMLADGAVIGGEQSGHIIFLEHATTGDGLVTALQLLAVMARTGRPLSELASTMTVYPQVMLNVETTENRRWADDAAIAAAIDAQRAALGASGGVLVRASGTEPLVRVTVEAADDQTALASARAIAEVVAQRLHGRIR